MTRKTKAVRIFLQKVYQVWIIIFMICGTSPGKENIVNFSRYIMTESVKLFSLRYGKGMSNIGISFILEKGENDEENISTGIGISDFTIDSEGNFYFADKVNGKIKKFNIKGEFIQATEDYLESVESVAVNPQGNIFVLYGNPSTHIAVYDNKGKRKMSEEEKINKVLPGLTLNYIRCDSSGSLYLFRDRYADSEELYYKINPSYLKLEVYKSRCPYVKESSLSLVIKSSENIKIRICQKTGEVIEYYDEGFLSMEVNVFDKNGAFYRKFNLPESKFQESEKIFPVIKVKYPVYDEKGHLYFLKGAEVIKEISLNSVPSWNFYIWGPIGVFEYDSNGRFVGIRAVFYGPAFMRATNFVKLDPEGNVYYLDFKSDRVDVMMAPAPKTDSKSKKRGSGKK